MRTKRGILVCLGLAVVSILGGTLLSGWYAVGASTQPGTGQLSPTASEAAGVQAAGLAEPAAEGSETLVSLTPPGLDASLSRVTVSDVDASTVAEPIQVAAVSPSALVTGALNATKAAVACYFTATPRFGAQPLTVQFTDESTTDAQSGNIVCWEWTFDVAGIDPATGGNVPQLQCDPTWANPTWVYKKDGVYTVQLRVTYENQLPDGTSTRTQLRNAYITVGTVPTATMDIQDAIGNNNLDGTALLPLSDWAPLFCIKMSYPEDQPAPRVLTRLLFSI